ncbi:hypothetical protein DFH06DRAFT_1383138, partial [Mycena polygramma]
LLSSPPCLPPRTPLTLGVFNHLGHYLSGSFPSRSFCTSAYSPRLWPKVRTYRGWATQSTTNMSRWGNGQGTEVKNLWAVSMTHPRLERGPHGIFITATFSLIERRPSECNSSILQRINPDTSSIAVLSTKSARIGRRAVLSSLVENSVMQGALDSYSQQQRYKTWMKTSERPDEPYIYHSTILEVVRTASIMSGEAGARQRYGPCNTLKADRANLIRKLAKTWKEKKGLQDRINLIRKSVKAREERRDHNASLIMILFTKGPNPESNGAPLNSPGDYTRRGGVRAPSVVPYIIAAFKIFERLSHSVSEYGMGKQIEIDKFDFGRCEVGGLRGEISRPAGGSPMKHVVGERTSLKIWIGDLTA